MAYRLSGLGATAAQIARCAPHADFWTLGTFVAALDPECWAYSPEAWHEMAQFQPPPQPTPVLTPPDLRMVPTDEAQAQATVDAIIAQNKAAQDQQYAAFYSSLEPVRSQSDESPTNWPLILALAALGAVVFMGMRR